MTKVDSIQLDFRLCRRRLKGIALASRLEKRVRLELGEEKLDLSSGCLVRVGAVGTVPRVSQPELTSDAVGLFVSRTEAEGDGKMYKMFTGRSSFAPVLRIIL